MKIQKHGGGGGGGLWAITAISNWSSKAKMTDVIWVGIEATNVWTLLPIWCLSWHNKRAPIEQWKCKRPLWKQRIMFGARIN